VVELRDRQKIYNGRRRQVANFDGDLAQRAMFAIPAQYLMIYELLWTPQDPSDRLSYDDWLTGYPGLVQL